MQFRMQRADDVVGLDSDNWDLAIAGHSLDERGTAAKSYAESNSTALSSLTYDVEQLRLTADSDIIECDSLTDWVKSTGAKNILIDATTLGFPEIAFCCRSVHDIGLDSFSILYVEPKQYLAPRSDNSIHRRDFELSDEIIGYVAIPGSALLLDEMKPQHAVFFLGYEGHRLERAFEQLPLVPERCSVVFGVPAYQAGWEMDAFANNIHVIRERNVEGGISYCAADNPCAAFELLAERYSNKKKDEQLFVAPIGTKPHGIGAAVFACIHPDVGLIYDHPLRSLDRTSEVGCWHLFRIEFDQK